MKKYAKFYEKMKIFIDKTIDLLFPRNLKCIFCEREVRDFENKPYCENCENTLPLNNKVTCQKCDGKISGEEKICDFCQSNKRYFIRAVTPFLYENEVRSQILKFKDNNAKYLARGFAICIAARLKENNIDFDYIIPIPISESSFKKRHYNQSKLLANEIGKISGKEVLDIVSINKIMDKQKTLNYKDRKENVKDAFKLSKDYVNVIRNKRLLIVDDIITTCATVNSCAKTLSKYTKNIYVCAIARNTIK